MDGSVSPGTKTFVESIRPLHPGNEGRIFRGSLSGHAEQRRHDSRLFKLW